MHRSGAYKWIKITCRNCGDLFDAKHKNKRYCSEICKSKHDREYSSNYRKTKLNKLPNNWMTIRWRILKRDNFTCQYCGRKAPNVELHIDHIIPQSRGDSDAEINLLTSCVECNIGKSDS